jgi:hypothetical protein
MLVFKKFPSLVELDNSPWTANNYSESVVREVSANNNSREQNELGKSLSVFNTGNFSEF